MAFKGALKRGWKRATKSFRTAKAKKIRADRQTASAMYDSVLGKSGSSTAKRKYVKGQMKSRRIQRGATAVTAGGLGGVGAYAYSRRRKRKR